MRIQQQIAELNRKRSAALALLQTLLEKAADEGRELTEEEQKLFDGHKSDVETIDRSLNNLVDLERLSAARARPAAVPDTDHEQAATNPASVAGIVTGTEVVTRATPAAPVRVEMPRKELPRGIRFARMAIATALAPGNALHAAEIAKARWGQETPEVAEVLRAAVAPSAIGEATSGATLALIENVTSEFIELLRPESVVARIPARRLQIGRNNTLRLPRQTGGATAAWVGELKSIPVGRLTLDQLDLTPNKLAVISIVSNELLQHSNPSIEMLVRDDLVQAVALALDAQFVNGTAVAGVSPAGLLSLTPSAHKRAATATVPAAPTIAEVTNDFQFIMTKLRSANNRMRTPVWIFNPRTIEFLRLQRTGQDVFAWKAEIDNGTLLGYPYLTSTSVPANLGAGTDESMFLMVDASEMIVVDDIAPTLEASTHAALQADTAPATPPTPLMSLFQQDATALRIVWRGTWGVRHAESLAAIHTVRY